MTAVKHAEDRDSLVIRLVNLSETTQTGHITHAGTIAEAYRLTLAEERTQTLVVDQGRAVDFQIAPRQIATIEIVAG